MRYFKPASKHRTFWALGLLICLGIYLNLILGAADISNHTLLKILIAGIHPNQWHHPSAEFDIIWQLRLLRVLQLILSGAALGLSGALLQGLLRNPLADPSLLGISSGAGLAVTSLMVFGTGLALHASLLSLTACLGALLACVLLYSFSEIWGSQTIESLILGGLAINAFCAALSTFLLTLAQTDILRNVFFWNLGDISTLNWSSTGLSAAIFIPTGVFLLTQDKALNVLNLGEENAFHCGLALRHLRISVLVGVSILSGVSVVMTGPLAFVGLTAPYLSRAHFGNNHTHSLLGSALYGSLWLLLANAGAEALIPGLELPLGVMTALLGAPFFLYLLRKKHRC